MTVGFDSLMCLGNLDLEPFCHIPKGHGSFSQHIFAWPSVTEWSTVASGKYDVPPLFWHEHDGIFSKTSMVSERYPTSRTIGYKEVYFHYIPVCHWDNWGSGWVVAFFIRLAHFDSIPTTTQPGYLTCRYEKWFIEIDSIDDLSVIYPWFCPWTIVGFSLFFMFFFPWFSHVFSWFFFFFP